MSDLATAGKEESSASQVESSPTRVRLIDATWRCIAEGGLTSATSRAITDRAGANLGAITYYFGSKSALIDETLLGAIRTLVAPAFEILADESIDPATGFLLAIKALQQQLDSQSELAPAYLEALLHSRHSDQLARAAATTLGDLRQALSERMADQVADNFLPAWVEPEVMAALLLAVAQGVVLQTIVDPSGPTHNEMTTQFAHILLAARRR